MKAQPNGRVCPQCDTPLARDNKGPLCTACHKKSRNALLGAPEVPPSFWEAAQMREALSARHMGKVVRAFRGHLYHGRPISQSVAAGWFYLTQTQLSRIENGAPIQDLDRLINWAHTLKIPSGLLWFTLPDQRTSKDEPASATLAISGEGDEWQRMSELLRRTFLKRGITFTSLPVANLGQSRRVLQALEVLDNDHLGGVVDGLGELIDHYALTICALPPAHVYDELLAVRSYVSGILDRSGSSPRGTDLALSAGWLSHLLAVAACDMGEHATARIWCSDAERRSQDVRQPELAAWSVLVRAMIAFYQGRPGQSVTLAAQGQEAAPVGTVVHAKLASQEMRAAAMAGDADRMTRSRRHAATAIAALPPDTAVTGAFSINLAEDPPYTATSLLLVGRCREAVAATDRVIETVYQPEARQRGEHPSGYARSLLILGLAHAGVGRLDEAVAAGQEALAGTRPAWPTTVLAGKLDRVLTQDFGGARQVVDYHARYLEATASLPTEHRPRLPGPAEDCG